jgi:large subunit ribosomal protein L3
VFSQQYVQGNDPMVKALLGKKVGMTQVFDEAGNRVPVTVLRVGPCAVTQVKSAETDNVRAVQIGFGDRKRKNTPKPMLGHFENAGVTPRQVVRDVEPEGEEMPELGEELTVEVFEGIGKVDVTGVGKGRGFAGVMRRHGFAGAPATHGGRFGRGPGSIGSSASPGRVLKGQRMPGHMGDEQVTVRNLSVVKILPEQNVMLVKGSVPGSKGGYVLVRKAVRPGK